MTSSGAGRVRVQWFGRALPVLGAGGAALALSRRFSRVHASGDDLVPYELPWNHIYPWQSFDHASLRRGWKVYSSVCATCHSMEYIAWRDLVNVVLTEDEAKAAAAEKEYIDGPNDEGEMYTRPGRLSDYLPRPYPNEQAARYANNGALPPDLSLIVNAREGGADYVFSLLTGYRPPPHGITLRSGLHYNPYFAGGALGMAQALLDGAVDYDDGTPATISQMAKDVTTFLCWAVEPETEERRRIWLKAVLLLVPMIPAFWYWNKLKWTPLKTRKIQFVDTVEHHHHPTHTTSHQSSHHHNPSPPPHTQQSSSSSSGGKHPPASTH